jgi:hypothetical protein
MREDFGFGLYTKHKNGKEKAKWRIENCIVANSGSAVS